MFYGTGEGLQLTITFFTYFRITRRFSVFLTAMINVWDINYHMILINMYDYISIKNLKHLYDYLSIKILKHVPKKDEEKNDINFSFSNKSEANI